MPVRTDHILVVDVEATCWENRTPPPGQRSEIVEIGVCILETATLELQYSDRKVVRPTMSDVSEYCTALTGLKPDGVALGTPFSHACAWLASDMDSMRRIWASWGNYDRTMFEQQCETMGIPYPFGPTHLNVKALTAVAHGWQKQVGMIKALSLLGLDLEGRHHRAQDDAVNTARLLAETLRRCREKE